MKAESPSISTGLGLFRLPAGLHMGFACSLLAACGGGDVSEDPRREPLAVTTTAVPAYDRDDLYRFFAIAFGAAPGVTYMGQLVEAAEVGRMSIKEIVNVFTTKSQFLETYPASLTNQEYAQKLVDNVVGTSANAAAKAEAVADIVEALKLPNWTRGDITYAIFNNLAKKPADDAKWAGTAKKMANQVAYARHYTETMKVDTTVLTELRAVVKTVTESSPINGAELSALIQAAVQTALASTVSGLDSSGLATLEGGSGIVFTANGVTRKYQVSNSPVSSSATGYLLSYQSEASAGALDASIYVPNKPGVYACGSGVSAATQNGYFNTSQIAWIAFTGTAFGGTPLSNFGGSCTIEVLSTSPRLEGRFIAQLFGAAAGDGKVTSGYFSAPLVITASTATVGTGTGSLLLTARNASVPAKHVGTMQITQFGLEVINGVCVYSGAGAYAGSSESYILKISRAKGSGQVGGWELRSADSAFNAVASNIASRSIEITRTTRTVRIADNFGATGSASSVKVEGSVKWTDVGDVTGC